MSKWFQIGLDTEQLRRDAKQANRMLNDVGHRATVQSGAIGQSLRRAGLGMVGFFSVKKLVEYTHQMVRVRGEFEKLEVAFETMLGNKAEADRLMAQVVDFAAKTPFTLGEVASGAKQLMAYRIETDKILPTLKALGDVSAGLGVPMERLILNYGQVRTASKLTGRELRDFNMAGVPLVAELSKNLNVSERAIQDMVSAGKIGFKEVEHAFVSMTQEGGQFAHLMDKQSETIAGRISNLQDAIERMFNEWGKASEGVIGDAIDGAGWLVENYQKVGREIGGLVLAYGTYRAAVVSLNVALRTRRNLMVMVNGMARVQMALNKSITKSEAVRIVQTKLLTKALYLQTKAQIKANLAVLKNPYVLAAMALATLVYGIYRFATAQSSAEKATQRFNERLKENTALQETHKETIQQLIETIQDETSTEYERIEALKALQRLHPTLFGNLTIEEAKYLNITEALKGVNRELEQKNRLSELQRRNELKEVADKLHKDARQGVRRVSSEDRNRGFDLLGVSGWEKATTSTGSLITQLYQEYELLSNREHKRIQIEEEARFNALSPLQQKQELMERNVKLQERINSMSQLDGQFNPLYKSMLKEVEDNKNAIVSLGQKGTEVLGETLGAFNRRLQEEQKKLNTMVQQYNAGKGTKDELQAQQELVDSLREEAKLRGADPRTQGKGRSVRDILGEQQEMEQRIRDAQKATHQYQIGMEDELERKRIAMMQEGREKRKAMIDFAYQQELRQIEEHTQRMLQANERLARATWERTVERDTEGNPTEQFAYIPMLTPKQMGYLKEMKAYAERERANSKKELLQDEQDKFKALLDQYATYQDRRKALSQEAEKKIATFVAKGREEGDSERYAGQIERVKEMLKGALSEIDMQEFTSHIDLADLFGNIDEQSSEALEVLRQKIISYLRQVGDSITPSDAKSLQDLLQKITEVQETRNPFGSVISYIEEYKQALADLKEAQADGLSGEQLQVFKEDAIAAFGRVAKSAQAVVGEIKGYADIAGGVMSAFGEEDMADDLDDIMGIVGGGVQAGVGVGKIASGDIVGGIKDVAQGVASVVTSVVSLNDKVKEREIKAYQEQIDRLKDSYQALANQIEHAYGMDASKLIEQQNIMLEQQKELIRNQIAAERKKKKTDKGKISAWEQRLREMDKQQESNKKKAIDAVFGSDVKSAIDSFADAYLDAWSAGEDKAKGMKEVVRDMIRSAIREMVKGDLQGAVERVRLMVRDALLDGYISDSEQAMIDREVEQMVKDRERKYKPLSKFLQSEEQQGGATYGEYKAITQQQAGYIDGRINAIQMISADSNVVLKEIRSEVGRFGDGFSQLRTIALDSWKELTEINKNTRLLIQTNAKLDKIVSHTAQL